MDENTLLLIFILIVILCGGWDAGSRLKVWSGAGHRVRPAKSPT
jgi:hypothetical protein